MKSLLQLNGTVLEVNEQVAVRSITREVIQIVPDESCLIPARHAMTWGYSYAEFWL